MMLRYTPEASNDLSDIWDYSARIWNADQADRYVLAIEAACEALADGAIRGRPADEYFHGYFRLRSGSHYIFYLIRDGGVDVIRVLHERMDIARHMKN